MCTLPACFSFNSNQTSCWKRIARPSSIRLLHCGGQQDGSYSIDRARRPVAQEALEHSTCLPVLRVATRLRA
ncbi:unnamed protein product [Mycena citricolor]|uniref:Uncharacterized protein n=1 Tax=Mycena citricolor TaxID=2018698 RepID=A0AAD2JWL8_9AGAR|nr:unnamed protein product [Mycena citricolor]CAK5280378.1 unnamed protein product [Mycena citricolor]